MIRIDNQSRVLFLGDSITDIKFNRRFAYQLKGPRVYALQVGKVIGRRCPGAKVFYRGVASDRAYLVYDRLTRDCIDLKPNVVIFLIGVNDAWEQYVPEQYPPLRRPLQPHLDEIYRRLHAELDDVQILYLSPFLIDTMPEKYPFHRVLNDFKARLDRTALQNGAQVLDLQQMFNAAQQQYPPKKLSTDGVHPTNFGHRLIACAVLDQLVFG